MMIAALLVEPIMPVWCMLACLVVFALMAWRTYAQCNLSLPRRGLLFSLRLIAFVIICWLMLQPMERSQKVIREKNSLVVVIDESASMEDRPLGITKSRAERTRELLQSKDLRKLKKSYQMLCFRIGDGVRRGRENDPFVAGQSRLLADLAEVRKETRGERPFAIMLFSDGLDTTGLSAEGLVMDVPFVIPELENPQELREDSRLDYGVDLPDHRGVKRVVKGWKTSIRVTVNRLRGEGKDVVPVTLSQGDKELEVRMVNFQKDSRYAQTVFELTPQTLGNHAYQVRIKPNHDVEPVNNQAEFILEVTDEENRVLYLEGLLRPEFKFFKRALQKEKRFQTSVYLRMGNGLFMNFEDSEATQENLSMLLTENNLKRFKVLILGEFDGDSFTDKQLAAVSDFVERGGGLWLVGASRAYGKGGYLTDRTFGKLSPVQSLAEASMVEREAFPLTFSPAGRNDSVFMKLAAEASFPPLRSLWQPVKVSQGAIKILETDNGMPVLAARRYAEGRVCMTLSNTLYLLRLHGGTMTGENDYDRLVSQTVCWMLPDMAKDSKREGLQILVKDDGADVNQTISVGALAGENEKAEHLHCEVTWPDGRLTTLPMQQALLEAQVGLAASKNGFLSEFKASQVGAYAVEVIGVDGQRTGKKMIMVRRPALEMTGKPVNRKLLKQLASGSKGKFIPLGEFKNPLEGILVPRREKETIREKSLWDSWFWLLPLMTLFCLEWTLRRRWELV